MVAMDMPRLAGDRRRRGQMLAALLGFGPRTGRAALDLHRAIYGGG